MPILALIVVVLILLSLAIYAVGQLPVIPANFRPLINVVLVLIAILVILQRSGLLGR